MDIQVRSPRECRFKSTTGTTPQVHYFIANIWRNVILKSPALCNVLMGIAFLVFFFFLGVAFESVDFD
jgi:hypothetical protein